MDAHATGYGVPPPAPPPGAPLATFVGIAVAVAGFGAIGLAWNGAAELDYVQGQFPFFVSGGLAGLGLVVVGTTMMVIETVRRQAAQQHEEMVRLVAALAALQRHLGGSGVPAPTPEAPGAGAGQFRPRPRTASQPPPPVPDGATQDLGR